MGKEVAEEQDENVRTMKRERAVYEDREGIKCYLNKLHVIVVDNQTGSFATGT